MKRIVLFLWAAAAVGQAPLSFEVASIKPASPPRPGAVQGTKVNPGGVEFHDNLRGPIAYAYGVRDYQITAPAWLVDARFDVIAKAPEGAATSQFPEMMRTLLAERFKLEVHKEAREFQGYALAVGKDGPKLTKAGSPTPGAYNVRATFRWGGGGGGKREYKSITMDALARSLAGVIGRPVLDETHLEGAYDLSLEFNAYDTMSGHPAQLTGDDPGVSVFRSIQDLGLKLEPRKIPGEMIVVDRMERTPTEN